MNISTVNELIQSLESAGELSIKETKVMVLAKAYQQLAAENVALKLAIPEPRNVEFDNDSMDDVSLAEDVGFNDAIGQMKINISKTPATDRIVAGIKADGVEMFAKALDGAADIFGKSKAREAQENFLYFAGRGFAFAKQLREGADK
ncbi:hypothetical protein ACRCWK_000041 [Klebsiella pneumoniae]